jgi:ATP phosphoribosyltransferase regulatory subunit HisZ
LQGAPRLLDFLREHDAESLEHFETLCRYLDDLGIPYEIDHDLVRGFDYYSRTAFEWVSDLLGRAKHGFGRRALRRFGRGVGRRSDAGHRFWGGNRAAFAGARGIGRRKK